jgi:hypothetical protein
MTYDGFGILTAPHERLLSGNQFQALKVMQQNRWRDPAVCVRSSLRSQYLSFEMQAD